jgi:hypothetical protein
MLSVYTRHHPDCKNADDKTWRRCGCPKWIWGSLDGKFIRQSARTHRWEEAEDLRRQLSEGLVSASRPLTVPVPAIVAAPPPPPIADPERPRKPRVTVEAAVCIREFQFPDAGVIIPCSVVRMNRAFSERTRIESRP